MDNSSSMMDAMSDSESSDSSDSQSNSSAASTSSSDSDASSRSLEPTRILKHNLELPKGLCENKAIFEEFFSLETWNCLPDQLKDQLKTHMPRFTSVTTSPQEEHQQYIITIQKLFSNQITRFESSPLNDFYQNLEEGNYRPDIARLRANIRKSQRREQRFQQCERISRLAKSLAISREKLLRAAYDSPPTANFRARKLTSPPPKLSSSAVALRAKKRYFQEISGISEDVGIEGLLSEDENYPEGPPVQLSKKQRKHFYGNQGAAMPGCEPRIQSTTTQRGGGSSTVNLDHLIGSGGQISITDELFRDLLTQHKKRKAEEPDHPELDTVDITIGDVNARVQQSGGKRTGHPGRPPGTTKKHLAKLKAEAEFNLSSESTGTLSFKLPSDDPHISGSPSLPSLNHLTTSESFNNLHNSFSDSESELDIKQEVKTEVKIESGDDEQSPFFVPLKPVPTQTHTFDSKSKKQRFNSSVLGTGSENGANIVTNVISSVIDRADEFIVKDEKIEPLLPYDGEDAEQNAAIFTTSPLIKTEKNVSEKQRGFVSVASYSGKPLKAATISDLEGIDMMHLPIDLDDSGHIDILNDIVDGKQELIQETHACFLSLIRDIFCSTPDHRTTTESLRARISAWVANPITALNEWFSQADSWLSLLSSAIHFLAGEFLDQPDEFVPYVEFKHNLKIYQWIGAGRDSDQHLKPLCDYWLRRRHEMGTKPPRKHQNEVVQPPKVKQTYTVMDLEESLSNNSNNIERLASPPPPRYPTTWMVNKATADEMSEFREQERRRFENPHLSFTYRMHGYESVVGPVKGIYTQIPALTKARGHNMLTQDRPNFVTILTLVRDATARLPNGEGTRADICELLKSSQYISPLASETVLQTIVSGALDRMHTEHDPCVRYDTKRKIWIYLHRGRTEEEFERMHQQFQGVSKHKKQSSRKLKTKLTPTSKSPTPRKAENSSDALSDSVSPGTPPAVKPKKKVVISTTSNQVIAPIAVATSSPSATVKIQAVGLSTVHLAQNQQANATVPQMPALSSIQNPNVLHSGNLPPLINKVVQPQKKTFVKPELVPIVLDNVDHIDVEATLDVHTTPIPVKKAGKQQIVKQIQQPQMPSLIVDKTHKLINKNVVKPVVGIVASAATTPIKVSTSSGIQTVHVSAAHQSLTKPTIATILTPANSQSVLVTGPQNSALSPTRKVTSKAPPPLIAQSTPTNHGFVTIPISIGKANPQIKQLQAIVSPAGGGKIQKTAIPALTSTVVPRMSLLQTQQPININKTIIRSAASSIPAGKSLISPSVANNIALQQVQTQQVVQSTGVQVIQSKPLQQQKIIVASVASSGAGKTTFVTSSTSNPIVVQKLISMSRPISTASTTATNTVPATTTTVTPVVQGLTAITSTGTSLINPQIIQIHQTGGQRSPQLATTAKLQAVSTANLTTLQQQNLIQSIKEQRLRVQNLQAAASPQQQTLIIKQQQVLQHIQKQLQHQQQMQINSPTKPGTSLLGTQIQLSPSTSGGKVTSMIVTGPTITATSTQSQSPQTLTRTVKAGTSLITQTGQTQQVITANTNNTVRTTTGSNPLVGKVLTNAVGQIISLESLLQKQNVSGPTLRIAGAKPGQTSLIQLSGTPGSQVAQYAVVSQGRNILSMAQPRIITTQAGGTVINASTVTSGTVNTASIRTGGVSVLASSIPATDKTNTDTSQSTQTRTVVAQAQGITQQLSTSARVIQSAQLQSINAQTLVNAKVLGVQNIQGVAQATSVANRAKAGTSIRMVNASNLNIAHIGGKPVIIASKAPTLIQQQSQQSTTPTRQNVIWTQNAQVAGGQNNIVIGGQTVKVQGNVLTTASTQFDENATGTALQTTQSQTVMFGNQIVKLQTHQPVTGQSQMQGQTTAVISTVSGVGTSTTTTPTRTVVLGSTGQTIKVHTPTIVTTQSGSTSGKVVTSSQQQVVIGSSALKNVIKGTTMTTGPGQRVVLAVQGGSQILLPANFQGGSINLKSLQGLKMIPIQQQQIIQNQTATGQVITTTPVPRVTNQGSAET